MKKLGLLMMAGVVAFGLSSCGGGDDGTESKPTPKFEFVTDIGYTSKSGAVDPATELTIGIDATGSENLESIGVRVKKGGGSELVLPLSADGGDSIITSLKVKDFRFDFKYTTGSIATTEVITVIVKMSNGTSTSKSLSFAINNTPLPVRDSPGWQMGAQNNSTYGSYYSMTDNKVLFESEANAAPATVDWVYYHGSTKAASFASPDDQLLLSSGVMGNSSLNTWSKHKMTRFKKASNGFDFAGLTTSTQLDAELTNNGTATLTTVNQMAVNDVYIFVTEGNKQYGAIKITGIPQANAAGSIQFDMKFVAP